MTTRIGLVLALFCGCGGEGTEATPQGAATEESVETAEAATPTADEVVVNEVAAEAPPAEGGTSNPVTQQGLQHALAQALQAARSAEGGTPCEQAYNGAMAMVNALAENGNPPPEGVPKRDDFLTGCNRLPETAQQCMVLNYAAAHQQECSTIMRSPEIAEFRESIQRDSE